MKTKTKIYPLTLKPHSLHPCCLNSLRQLVLPFLPVVHVQAGSTVECLKCKNTIEYHRGSWRHA